MAMAIAVLIEIEITIPLAKVEPMPPTQTQPRAQNEIGKISAFSTRTLNGVIGYLGKADEAVAQAVQALMEAGAEEVQAKVPRSMAPQGPRKVKDRRDPM